MKIMLGILALLGVGVLVADALSWTDVDMISTFLSLGLGLICLIWKWADGPKTPAPQPLRVLLMRNVISRVDRKPPIPVEIRKLYSQRWDAGK